MHESALVPYDEAVHDSALVPNNDIHRIFQGNEIFPAWSNDSLLSYKRTLFERPKCFRNVSVVYDAVLFTKSDIKFKRQYRLVPTVVTCTEIIKMKTSCGVRDVIVIQLVVRVTFRNRTVKFIFLVYYIVIRLFIRSNFIMDVSNLCLVYYIAILF